MTTLTYTGELTIVSCWCGIKYAIPQSLYTEMQRLKDERRGQPDVYCPLGHTWVVAGESAADRLRKQVTGLEQTVTSLNGRLDDAERSKAAYKGQVTKLKKRAVAGVCAFCHRHFVNVERHVASQHPGEGAEA